MIQFRKGLRAYDAYSTWLNPADWSRLSAWWCTKTGFCSAETEAAARILRNPDFLGRPPMPAVPGAPVDLRAPLIGATVAERTAYANALPGELAADAMRRTQNQNLEFFTELDSQVNPLDDSGSGGLSTLAWVGVGVAAVAVAAAGFSGRRRR